MKKLINVFYAILVGLVLISSCRAEQIIMQDETIFAVIEKVEEDHLTLRSLHSVFGQGGAVLWSGSIIKATLLPLPHGGTRRAACVWQIEMLDQKQYSVPSGVEQTLCLAQLHDARGRAGLIADTIYPQTIVRVYLDNDLILMVK